MTAQPTKLIQIVPRLPPYSDGVGDYARLLAKQLSNFHQIETEFVAFRPGNQTPNQIDGFYTHWLFTHTADSLLALIAQNANGVILHYSNYPYLTGKLDAPFWLTGALETLARQRAVPLVVMFHELPTLKWRNFRTLNPIQSRVSRGLAKTADAVITDSQHFKTHLEKWTNAPVTCIPDFSTIGEPHPSQIQPLHKRKLRLVIFGSSDRKRAYRDLTSLMQTCRALGIQEICDIGTPQNIDPNDFEPITFRELGFQPAEAVCQILLESKAGLIDYSRFPGDLGKSSVFAAFCAHGLLPICTEYNPSEPDGVFVNKQYVTAGEHLSALTAQQCQTVANQSRAWYCQHSLAINAKLFASHFS